jgi:hypothetical protein
MGTKQAVIRKIWDDRPRPQAGVRGRTYAGYLTRTPTVGERLQLYVEDRGEEGSPYLRTEPVVSLAGSEGRGWLVDTGRSIYRVRVGPESLAEMIRGTSRRHFQRLRLTATVSVAAEGALPELAMTADLGPGGLSFESVTRYQVGQILEVTLSGTRTVSARVLRVRDLGGDEGFETAVEFERTADGALLQAGHVPG